MKRTTSLKRKTPMRRISKKREPELRKYIYKRNIWLKDKICEWPATTCTNQATDLHHGQGRRGKLLNNEKHWWALCREHHRWIHDHPNASRQLGVLK